MHLFTLVTTRWDFPTTVESEQLWYFCDLKITLSNITLYISLLLHQFLFLHLSFPSISKPAAACLSFLLWTGPPLSTRGPCLLGLSPRASGTLDVTHRFLSLMFPPLLVHYWLLFHYLSENHSLSDFSSSVLFPGLFFVFQFFHV